MKSIKMTTEQVILILLIGLIGGIISGVIGVGGGVFIVPLLVLILGFTQHKAQGTFILMAVFPVQILSAIKYYKAGNIDWKVALLLLITFTIGSYVGAVAANDYLSPNILKKIFGLFLLFTSIRLLFFK